MQGNLINRLQERTIQPTPEVGMGATLLMYSDRQAGTIVSAGPKTLVWQRDKATRTDSNGMSDAQGYRYEPDPDGVTRTFTLRQTGQWVQQGESAKGGTKLGLGYRDEHYDYSF
jgi:hypothetical protein